MSCVWYNYFAGINRRENKEVWLWLCVWRGATDASDIKSSGRLETLAAEWKETPQVGFYLSVWTAAWAEMLSRPPIRWPPGGPAGPPLSPSHSSSLSTLILLESGVRWAPARLQSKSHCFIQVRRWILTHAQCRSTDKKNLKLKLIINKRIAN